MAIPNIYSKQVADILKERIHKLQKNTEAQWGKMTVSQMLAHCNVTYELAFENLHKKPNFFTSWILKTFVKKIVTNEVPYKKNSRTAPAFLITDAKIFELEKNRLINYIDKTVELGEDYFEGKESHSFGKLNKTEWNNMFYKHLDHHLTQFGV